MTRNEFTKIIKTIFDDRNVQNLSSDWLNNLYEVCKGIDLRTAMIGANKLMNISSEDWNGLYGYRGKPSTCDLKTFLSGGKPTSIERRAESEVQKIIDQSKYWHDFSKTNTCIASALISLDINLTVNFSSLLVFSVLFSAENHSVIIIPPE